VIFGGLKTSVTTGYGPVRYFDAKLVAETAAALAGADRKSYSRQIRPGRDEEAGYLCPAQKANEKKAILQVIEELAAFFQKAAAAHEDVITFVW